MSDIGSRLRVVDHVPTPDVWERATALAEGVSARERVLADLPSRGRRMLTVLVAMVVAFGGIFLVVRAFEGEGDLDVAEPAPASAEGLVETSWVLASIDGRAVQEQGWMTLAYHEDDYAARAGCNTTGGGYDVEGGRVRPQIGELVTCGALSTSQQAFFDTVSTATAASLDAATLTLMSDEHSLGLVQDPCSILTENDVATATGDPVASSGLVPPEQMRIPGLGPVCSYEVPGRFTSVGVEVASTSMEAFEAERDSDPANTDIVQGIGEGAYIHGLGSIVVFDRGREIEIGFQHGPGTEAVPVLEQLARAALDGSNDPLTTGTLAALEIAVRRTTDPADLHITATYRGQEIDLDGIETPGPDLAYPKADAVTLPVGTPIQVQADTAGTTVSVFQLLPAQGQFVVENGSCIVPGALREMPGPGSSGFFIWVEGSEMAGGVAFVADTVGEPLDHEAALDPDAAVDAKTQGLTVCGVPA